MIQNYTVFLSGASDKTTNSDVTVSNDKDGVVVSGGEAGSTSTANDVQANTNAEVSTADNGTEQTTQATPSGGLFGGGITTYIIIYAVFIAGFYFLAIRPQRKKQKELSDMVSSLEVGDDILTSSGYYGKIVDMTEDVCVVEFGTNRGVRIPVRKSEIIRKEVPKI